MSEVIDSFIKLLFNITVKIHTILAGCCPFLDLNTELGDEMQIWISAKNVPKPLRAKVQGPRAIVSLAFHLKKYIFKFL